MRGMEAINTLAAFFAILLMLGVGLFIVLKIINFHMVRANNGQPLKGLKWNQTGTLNLPIWLLISAVTIAALLVVFNSFGVPAIRQLPLGRML